LKPINSINLTDIENEAYAYLITEYLLYKEENRPRFILLGFDDVRSQIREKLEQKRIPVIEPERTGRLKEASLLRGSSQEIGVILVSRQNLGKFASLVTAFKVLEEVINVESFLKSLSDVHDLIDVSKWLISSLGKIGSFIESKLGPPPSETTYDGVKVVLNEILALTKRKPSFAEWLHPRRIIRGLVLAVDEKQKGKLASVGSLLRSIGLESKAILNNVPIFRSDISDGKNLDELRITLNEYSRVLKSFIALSISSQRRNLANLCMNSLRMMLLELAKAESTSTSQGKWTEIFCDFEHAFKGRRKTIKKYKVETRGVRIIKRSSVSGLPKCLHVPLEVTLEKNSERNLLEEFWNGELDRVLQEYSRLHKLTFSIKPVMLLNHGKKLIVEFTVREEDGNIALDPFIEGLKSPSLYINKLLASLKRGKG
jgi:hypothetical protein